MYSWANWTNYSFGIFDVVRYVHVCLLYGVDTSIILVEDNCNYIELVHIVILEMGLDSKEDTIIIKCIE